MHSIEFWVLFYLVIALLVMANSRRMFKEGTGPRDERLSEKEIKNLLFVSIIIYGLFWGIFIPIAIVKGVNNASHRHRN